MSDERYWVTCDRGASACVASTPDHVRGGHDPARGPGAAHGDDARAAAFAAGWAVTDTTPSALAWTCPACVRATREVRS